MSFQRRQLLRFLSIGFGSNFILSRNGFDAAAQTATQPTIPPPPAGAAVETESTGGAVVEKVTGIGGFSSELTILKRWHIGISKTWDFACPNAAGESAWQQEAGTTAFSPFPEKSNYFGDPNKVWMMNFRVRDIDKMVAQLRAAGIEVKIDPQSYPYGRFARLHDPEGNPIELWQPKVPDTKN